MKMQTWEIREHEGKKEKGLNTWVVWEQFYTWWKPTTSQFNFCSFWCKSLRSCFLFNLFGVLISVIFLHGCFSLLSPENRRYFWLGMISLLPTALWTDFLPILNVSWELVRFWLSKQDGLALCQLFRKKNISLTILNIVDKPRKTLRAQLHQLGRVRGLSLPHATEQMHESASGLGL